MPGAGGRKRLESQLFPHGLGLRPPGVPLLVYPGWCTPAGVPLLVYPSSTLPAHPLLPHTVTPGPRHLCRGPVSARRHREGPRRLWAPASHSGAPSHRNVSKSHFDPVSPVCSHSPFLPPPPRAAVRCSQPEVCGVPVAPEAGTHSNIFHGFIPSKQASPRPLIGCLPLSHRATRRRHPGGAVTRPPLSSPPK